MNVNFLLGFDAIFHCVILVVLLQHPEMAKKELAGADLVLHLLVLFVLLRAVELD
jgi:hypothetical protein